MYYLIIIIIILYISYITVQQQGDVCKKKLQKYNRVVACNSTTYMVVKYITMSLAVDGSIESHVIVSSHILIHSAIMLAFMSSSV